ncbi:MAG: hypothetical protein IJR47_01715 [Clostridia bacterium]|nr:hypothetical protein [Clostridia bacterium]
MRNSLTKREYIEYLLKNYHRILNDLEQMRIELEHYEIESVDETIEGMSLNGAREEGIAFKDDTPRVAMVFRNVNKRINAENKRRILKQIAAGEIEFKKLRTAIECLPEETRNVIEDLYIKRLKWDMISMTRYISNNTINRHRKKGIDEITRAFFLSEDVA